MPLGISSRSRKSLSSSQPVLFGTKKRRVGRTQPKLAPTSKRWTAANTDGPMPDSFLFQPNTLFAKTATSLLPNLRCTKRGRPRRSGPSLGGSGLRQLLRRDDGAGQWIGEDRRFLRSRLVFELVGEFVQLFRIADVLANVGAESFQMRPNAERHAFGSLGSGSDPIECSHDSLQLSEDFTQRVAAILQDHDHLGNPPNEDKERKRNRYNRCTSRIVVICSEVSRMTTAGGGRQTGTEPGG